jgi:D-3-phosphoglycerate dehydrogenase
MKKVVLTYDSPGGLEYEQQVFSNFAELVKMPCETEEDLIKNCKDADAVLCVYEPFTAFVMDNLPKLKIIAVKAIGVDTVDIEAAKQRGIAVTNIPEYCINEVADHTVMLILAINRRLIQFHNSVQQDKVWKYDICQDISRLGECTVGLMGFGNIPRLVTQRLRGFGSKILAYDPFVDVKIAKEYGVHLVDIDELYSNSDYICCHLPHNKHTEKMVNREAFDKMKDGVVFINTGRGKVVDEKALIDALDKGKVGYSGLDVLENENPDMNISPLNGRNNVILTPHIAYYSKASIRDAKIHSAENILYYLKGDYEKCSIVNGVNA